MGNYEENNRIIYIYLMCGLMASQSLGADSEKPILYMIIDAPHYVTEISRTNVVSASDSLKGIIKWG